MAEVLMAWNDFKKNARVVSYLQRALKEGHLGHAYLMTGESPQKLEIARHIAAALNCLEKPGEGCGQVCLPCRKIHADEHPDVRIIRAESKSRRISIDLMRELERAAHLKPSEGLHKVGIVVDADRFTEEAQNAFLKTLEEPPPKTTFLLLTSEPQQLRPTILSRCLRMALVDEGTLAAGERELRLIETLKSCAEQKDTRALFRTYRMIDQLQRILEEIREDAEKRVEALYEGRGYENLEGDAADRFESEKAAQVEALYRQDRAKLIQAMEMYFRDLAVLSPEETRHIEAFETLETANGQLNRSMNEGLVLELSMMRLGELTGT